MPRMRNRVPVRRKVRPPGGSRARSDRNTNRRPWRIDGCDRWSSERFCLRAQLRNPWCDGLPLSGQRTSGWFEFGFLPHGMREIEVSRRRSKRRFSFRITGRCSRRGRAPISRRVSGRLYCQLGFARLNEATVRVLQKNGCEVSIPESQTCCGALHVHAGMPDEARKLARRNIDAIARGAASTPSSPMPPDVDQA